MSRVYGSINTPMWVIILERKIAKHDSRFSILYFILMFGSTLSLAPLSPNMFKTISESIIIIGYYVIYYIILFISLYIGWRLFVKPYKINKLERLAINFFRVGSNLEQINLGLDFDNRLKGNINNLLTQLKKLNKIYENNTDIKYKTSIENVINNITKLNDYKTEQVKYLLENERLSDNFVEISEILIKEEEYSNIKKQIIDLDKILEGISKIKYTEKYFIDVYTFIVIFLIGILIALALALPEYQSILAIFIGVFITLLLSRMYRKNLF